VGAIRFGLAPRYHPELGFEVELAPFH
jgi:hypothetical protein